MYSCDAVTVCIAGICQPRNPLIVLCTDGRVENGCFGGESLWKTHIIASGWIALAAGDVSSSTQLVTALRAWFRSPDFSVEEDTILDQIQRCVFAHRRKLSNDLTQRKLSISFDEFMQNGIRQLPEDIHRQVLWDLQGLTIDCEIILVGFVPMTSLVETNGLMPRLFTINADGKVVRKESFAVVGSGWAVAECSLFQRGYSENFSAFESFYSIYEAKRLSEMAPGVGWMTSMMAIQQSKDGSFKIGRVEESGMAFLEKHLPKCGPQPIRQFAPSPQDFLSQDFGAPISLLEKQDSQLTKADQSRPKPSPGSPEATNDS